MDVVKVACLLRKSSDEAVLRQEDRERDGLRGREENHDSQDETKSRPKRHRFTTLARRDGGMRAVAMYLLRVFFGLSQILFAYLISWEGGGRIAYTLRSLVVLRVGSMEQDGNRTILPIRKGFPRLRRQRTAIDDTSTSTFGLQVAINACYVCFE